MKITLRDDSLPHQIRILWWYGNIAVSCNCRERDDPIEVRHLWQPHEPMEVWRAHMVDTETTGLYPIGRLNG